MTDVGDSNSKDARTCTADGTDAKEVTTAQGARRFLGVKALNAVEYNHGVRRGTAHRRARRQVRAASSAQDQTRVSRLNSVFLEMHKSGDIFTRRRCDWPAAIVGITIANLAITSEGPGVVGFPVLCSYFLVTRGP